jgi:hypothetical protein
MEDNQIEVTGSEGYHLFQRAIMDCDEDAWAASVARYRPLLIAWASARSAALPAAEHCDDIADQAFARVAGAHVGPMRELPQSGRPARLSTGLRTRHNDRFRPY